MTLVEDSTHLSANAVLTTGSATLFDNFSCQFDKGANSAQCTNIVVAVGSGQTTTISETKSGSIVEATVPIAIPTSTSAGIRTLSLALAQRAGIAAAVFASVLYIQS